MHYIALLSVGLMIFMLYPFKDRSQLKELQGTIRKTTKKVIGWLLKLPYTLSKKVCSGIKPEKTKSGKDSYFTRKLVTALLTGTLYVGIVAIVAYNINSILDGILAFLR